MPSGVGNPNKQPQRDDRQPKNTPNKIVRDNSVLLHSAAPSTPNQSEKGKSKRRVTPHVVSNQASTILTSANQPAQADTTNVPSAPIDLPAPSTKQIKGKRKMSNPQGNLHRASSSPAPRKERSPRPGSQNLSLTPKRPNVTPAQAYAGPTFHASPAPSALPIPKFFSKSLPPAENNDDLKAMLQEHSSEDSSTKSDDSPTMSNLLHIEKAQTREASPLDMFFNADREEKARRLLGTRKWPTDEDFNSLQKSSQVNNVPRSPTPSLGPVSGHTHHTASSSTPDVFPLEMDASEKAKTPNGAGVAHAAYFPDMRDLTTSPSIKTRIETDEQRKAKSIALKKLLMSPKPQLPPSGITKSGTTSISASLSPSPTSRPNKPIKSLSSSSTPQYRTGNPSKLNQEANGNRGFPQPYPSPVTPTSGRPASSYLRQEVAKDDRNETDELPSTPTPSRSRNTNNSAVSQNNRNTQLNRAISPLSAASRPYSPHSVMKSDTNRDNHNEIMEDALRRILKLDMLSRDGGTEIQS